MCELSTVKLIYTQCSVHYLIVIYIYPQFNTLYAHKKASYQQAKIVYQHQIQTSERLIHKMKSENRKVKNRIGLKVCEIFKIFTNLCTHIISIALLLY